MSPLTLKSKYRGRLKPKYKLRKKPKSEEQPEKPFIYHKKFVIRKKEADLV